MQAATLYFCYAHFFRILIRWGEKLNLKKVSVQVFVKKCKNQEKGKSKVQMVQYGIIKGKSTSLDALVAQEWQRTSLGR